MSGLYGLFAQPRHKVFVSYHHSPQDQMYRNAFEYLFAAQHGVMISQSVQIGDIDPNIQTDTIRQKIRDEFLCDSTVTVVLIGAETWQRKHVDWEIGSSIRQTLYSSRSGLLGILLPTYPRQDLTKYDPYTIPPRLHANIACGYAKIYNWSNNPNEVQQWIHAAYARRTTFKPDNAYPNFCYNKSGARWS